MIFSCNRFAIIPHMCNECKRYIWLESYRRADVWKHDRFIMENICKHCLPKFFDVDADSKLQNGGTIMSLREFKNKYFEDWRIAGISTYGNERGYIKLRDKDSFIKLYFKFNGAKHWADDCVALDYIEGCDMD